MTDLSIVVAGRNDNYGKNFLRRLQNFITVLRAFWPDSSGRQVELVVVEWNPPPDRQSFATALEWPVGTSSLCIRIVTVPEKLHSRIQYSSRVGLFEYFAKNVGVRRATGKFVLVTNPDIIFSEDMLQALGRFRLDPGYFYRADRYDFAGDLPRGATPEEMIEAAKARVHTVHRRQEDGHKSEDVALAISDTQRNMARHTGEWPGSISSERLGQVENNVIELFDETGPYGGLHTNASGDFLLASGELWATIHGFPEYADSTSHIDGYACHQFYAAGAKQAMFAPPCMIFHQDHERPPGTSRPQKEQFEWIDELKRIRTGMAPYAINSLNWGLGAEELSEQTVC